MILGMETYSIKENQYVIHLCSLPRNVSMLYHTPRVTLAASLDEFSHSDLFESGSISSFN